MTQIQLAEMVGVTQGAVANWCRGRNRPLHHVRELIEVTNGALTEYDLLYWDVIRPPRKDASCRDSTPDTVCTPAPGGACQITPED